MIRRLAAVALFAASTLLVTTATYAQTLGTFRWQLQPYCNVLTVTVVQDGSQYHVDGTDDLCGAARRASVVGLAFPNPDGSIGFGLTIVTAPGGAPVHVDATISLTSASGTWRDSVGNSGTFTFTPGGSSGGVVRPATAPPVIPTPISLLPEGGLVARGTGTVGGIPASGAGTRMMWYPQQAAFRTGVVRGTQWDAANVGYASTALGQDVTASRPFSTAIGRATTASGYAATALGDGTTASGDGATALGLGTLASGSAATALGEFTEASGLRGLSAGHYSVASGMDSVALGPRALASGEASFAAGFGATATAAYSRSWGAATEASGDSSTAIGVLTRARGYGSMAIGTLAEVSAAAPGSFVFGDGSTVGNGSGVVSSISPNQFLVRAAGGTVFWSTRFTTYPTSPGVILFSGDSAWSSLSDVNAKENFRELATDDVLARIAAMPVREWNYKAQDQAIRHIGPTAQDFHAAFGLGQDERRISTIDADGVALAGVKALEARTRTDVERLTRENEELKARLARLELLLEKK